MPSVENIGATCKHNKASGSIWRSIISIRAVIDRDSDVWPVHVVETEINLGTDVFEVNYLLRDKRHDLVN